MDKKTDNYKAMEYIWERIPKQKDGKTIRYLEGDLAYLYYHGFVDTNRYKLENWKNALLMFKQKDGSYVLTKDQFMILRKFRYVNVSYEPLDPYKLEEGPWPDKALKGLYVKTIARATTIPEKVFFEAVDILKKAGHTDKQGQLVIDINFKKLLNNLLIKYPSPRTILEEEVARLKKERTVRSEAHQKNPDGSNFTIGQTDKESKLDELNRLQASSQPKQASTPETESKETLDVKSLRKGNRPKKIKG